MNATSPFESAPASTAESSSERIETLLAHEPTSDKAWSEQVKIWQEQASESSSLVSGTRGLTDQVAEHVKNGRLTPDQGKGLFAKGKEMLAGVANKVIEPYQRAQERKAYKQQIGDMVQRGDWNALFAESDRVVRGADQAAFQALDKHFTI